MNFKEMLSKTRMAISDGVLFIKQFSFIKFLEGSSLNPDESTKKDLGTFEKLGQILVQFIDRHILRKGEVGENLALVGGEGGVSYLPTSSIKPLRFGLTLISLFFSFFFGWLIFAKLDGAVVAPGQVIFSKNKQIIQSSAGGVIEDILIREGDIVRKGQILMNFKNHDTKANYNMSSDRAFAIKVQIDRLIAQSNRYEVFTVSSILSEEAKNSVDKLDMLESQRKLFIAEQKALNSRMKVFEQKVKQLEKESEGLKMQRQSVKDQIGFVQDELRTVTVLLKDQAVSKTRLLGLKSQESQLLEKSTQYDSAISSNQERRIEIESEVDSFFNSRAKDFENEIKELKISLALEQEKILAVREALEKTTIRANDNGIITNLHYHKSDDVVPAGYPLMELLPEGDNLIIEAKLLSKDINSLLSSGVDIFNYNNESLGHLLTAKINFPTYSNRRYKKLNGTVFYIAADVAVDNRTGMTYYPLKIMIAKKELLQAQKNKMSIFPGMQAEAFILTDSRSPISYLVSPITASFGRAFID